MSKKWIIRTVAAAILVLAALITLSACGGGDDDGGDDGAGVTGVAEVSERFQGLPQSGQTVGEEGAAAEIIEYGDLQCPFCATSAETLNPQIIDQIVKPGDARLTFVPVAFIGPDSETGALAVLAAANQDLTWNLTEILYANQGDENSGWLSEDFARDAAAAAGLDLATFDEDFQADETVEALFDSRERFTSDEGSGTPHYVVRGPNGQQIFPGQPTIEDLQQAVQEVG
ncbi:MAG: DsbA family protein [Miltoncostaeaceae bacterium]